LYLILAILVIGGAITYLQYGKVTPSTDSISIEVSLPTDIMSTTTKIGIGAMQEISKEDEMLRVTKKTKLYPRAKEITTPDGFINSDGQPISIGQYVGKKVILLDIWTYSCINCQRTTPYLNSWYDKYESDGFVIIGLHTPEFEFEKNYDNVKAAVEKFGIRFPVVLDNDYSTWNAYGNLYWPRKYLIDIDGFVIYDHIGEGSYEETEKKIQEALKERALILGEETSVDVPVTKDVSIRSLDILSPETYFGFKRNEYLANGLIGQSGVQDFVLPSSLSRSRLYLEGAWDIRDEYALNTVEDATVVYPYVAREVYLVASASLGVDIEVYRDGEPVGKFAGEDVVGEENVSKVRVGPSRLYKLVKEDTLSAHTLELVVKGTGLKAFAFTFGN
jgi:thiol-disulfide isomerase/thioredoxin